MANSRRILFLGAPPRGHRNALLPTAFALSKRGHQISWLELDGTVEGCRQFADSCSFPVIPVTPSPYRAALTQEMKNTIDGEDRRTLMRKVFFEQDVDRLVGMAKELKPDILVMDSILHVGAVVAHKLGIDYVCVSRTLSCLAPPEIPSGREDFEIDGRYFFLKHRVPFRPSNNWVLNSPTLNIVGITKELVPGAVIPPNTELVGPFRQPDNRGDEVEFPWELLAPDKTKIYLGLGTVYGEADVYRRVIEACEGMDVQLIVSYPKPEELAGFSSNVHVFAYVPQVELLNRVDLFITHCGAGGVTEALFAGIPMLLVPLASDQPIQAEFMERSGIGIQVAKDAETEELRTALGSLLQSSSYSDRAAEVAESLRDTDGAERAADLILDLL